MEIERIRPELQDEVASIKRSLELLVALEYWKALSQWVPPAGLGTLLGSASPLGEVHKAVLMVEQATGRTGPGTTSTSGPTSGG